MTHYSQVVCQTLISEWTARHPKIACSYMLRSDGKWSASVRIGKCAAVELHATPYQALQAAYDAAYERHVS